MDVRRQRPCKYDDGSEENSKVLILRWRRGVGQNVADLIDGEHKRRHPKYTAGSSQQKIVQTLDPLPRRKHDLHARKDTYPGWNG